MGFPKSVKDQMLVAAARHCCVCHRYKGVKVEIHHIVPEADGGANSFENAIALCFDCHADAGHYNTRHPRGTKFSPEELRRARREWLDAVRMHSIQIPSEPGDFLCRYYICKSFEVLREITSLNLSRFPVSAPLLVKNHILRALADFISRHPTDYRHASHWGRKFESEEAYLEVYPHPDDSAFDRSSYPYFSQVRDTTQAELESLKGLDGVVDAMVEHGLPATDGIAVVGCYEAACEGVVFQEEYLLRELWCVFLALENISDEPVTLRNLDAIVSNRPGFEQLSMKGSEDSIRLPRAPIAPGATVIIPVLVVLPPLRPVKIKRVSSEIPFGIAERYLAISHCLMDGECTDYLTCGGKILPTSFEYVKSGLTLRQDVHQFDLTNFYEIDMHWGCGSCPHLFFIYAKPATVTYQGELLRSCQEQYGADSFVVSDGVNRLVIAELEDEVTTIVELTVNGEKIVENMTLKKGGKLSIPVSVGDLIEVKGKYQPLIPTQRSLPSGRLRNSLVHEFLESHCAWQDRTGVLEFSSSNHISISQ